MSIWSRYPPNLEGTNPSQSTVWFERRAEKLVAETIFRMMFAEIVPEIMFTNRFLEPQQSPSTKFPLPFITSNFSAHRSSSGEGRVAVHFSHVPTAESTYDHRFGGYLGTVGTVPRLQSDQNCVSNGRVTASLRPFEIRPYKTPALAHHSRLKPGVS